MKKLIKISQIYFFSILFMVGISISALINSKGSHYDYIPFIKSANASMELEVSPCDGYKQARRSDDLFSTMCGCDTVAGEGIVNCENDDTPIVD